MVKTRKYVCKQHFKGEPKKSDFEIVEQELPALEDGQALLKTEWVSVDPYLRANNPLFPTPFDQFGYQVAVVERSKNPKYPVGSRIVTHNGWCTYSIIGSKPGGRFLDTIYKLPNIQGMSPSVGCGGIGMPGATAYFGFLEICQPKAGETVVVTGAAGAVGSIVGQIAKIKGCKVIGFAGSDEKVEWLEKELGFDKALNYKKVDVTKALKEAAPKGVDCFFDNVGGELSSIIIYQMNDFGRVSVCGSISAYNNDLNQMPKATILQHALVSKELIIKGFKITRWEGSWDEAFDHLVPWAKSGQLKLREHITEGFDNIFDAFTGMLKGENTGKAVVKV